MLDKEMKFLKENFPNLLGKGHEKIFKEAIKFDTRQQMIPEGIKAKEDTKYKADVLFKFAAEVEKKTHDEKLNKKELHDKLRIAEAGAAKVDITVYNYNTTHSLF